MFTADLHFSELCGIHRSVTLSRIHSLHEMNARQFVKLKNISSVKNISYPFIQAEYHVFLPCIFTLLLLRLFSKNKENYNSTQKTEISTSKYKGLYSKKEITSV